jgi:hypothetical protein
MELTGYLTSDFVSNKVRSYESRMNRKDIQRIKKNMTEAIQTGWPFFNTEYRIQHKNGDTKRVYDSIRIVYEFILIMEGLAKLEIAGIAAEKLLCKMSVNNNNNVCYSPFHGVWRNTGERLLSLFTYLNVCASRTFVKVVLQALSRNLFMSAFGLVTAIVK